MPLGKKFAELNPTTDIDGLLGAAEDSDAITPGNKFIYSKTPNIASPSNAIVLTESAVVNLAPGTNAIYFGKGGNDSNTGLTWETRVLTPNQAYTLAQTAFGTPTSTNVVALKCFDAGEYAVGDWVWGAYGYLYLDSPDAHIAGQIIITTANSSFWINVRKLDQIGIFNSSTAYIKTPFLGTATAPINYYCVYYLDVDYLNNFVDGTGTSAPEIYGRVGIVNNMTLTARMVGDLLIGRSLNAITNPSATLSLRIGYAPGQEFNLNYYNGSGVTQKLLPNTTITPKFLQMIGNGTNGAVPAWIAQQSYNSIFVTRFGTDNTEAYVTIYSSTTGTGWINAAADFPTIAAVVDGGCYVVPSGVTVVDNDATKTNTGMSFTGPLQISWDAASTKWIRRTGKTIQDPVCSIAVASYLNYYYGATYGIECLDDATYNFADQFHFYGNVHSPLVTFNTTGQAYINTTTTMSLYFNLLTSTPSDGFGTGGLWLITSGRAYIQCNSARPLSDASPCKLFSSTTGELHIIANEIRNPNTSDYTVYTNGGSVWVNANRFRGTLYANSGTIYGATTITSSILTSGAGTIYLNNKFIQSVSVSTWACTATASTPTTTLLLSKDMATNTVTMSLKKWTATGNSSTAGLISATGVIPAAFRPTTNTVFGAVVTTEAAGSNLMGVAQIYTNGDIAIAKTPDYVDWNPGTGTFGFFDSTVQWNTAQ